MEHYENDLISHFLETADIFQSLSGAERRGLRGEMTLMEIFADEGLFEAGDPGDAVYFVLEGEIRLESDGVVVTTRRSGEWVGEFALIDQAPRSASAKAGETARLVRWSRDGFLGSLERHPALNVGLFRLLTNKLREDIEARVAHRLESEKWQLEMVWARELQQGLLPSPEAVLNGLELSCWCEPAGQVGGDLYDYAPVEGDSGGDELGLLVGDVTGHGVHSALMAAMAKSCFRNQLAVDPQPSAVIRALAGTMELAMGRRLLMSVAYAFIQDERLIYANAGHPPILHVTHDTALVTRLGALDPILGAVDADSMAANQGEQPLHPGDLLVLYTDGITEARNPAGEEFGASRLEALLARKSESSALSVKHSVLEAVREFAHPRPIDDDLTLAVIRVA